MKKDIENKVIPTVGLLTDMESLEIYGGQGNGGVNPNEANVYCYAKCECMETHKAGDCNIYCMADCAC